MNRTRQRALALGAALFSMTLVAVFVALDLYLWPQLRLPAAYLGAASFAVLVLLALGAVVFHFVNEADGHLETKIEAEKASWRNALAKR